MKTEHRYHLKDNLSPLLVGDTALDGTLTSRVMREQTPEAVNRAMLRWHRADGIESGSQRVLDLTRKRLTIESEIGEVRDCPGGLRPWQCLGPGD